MSKFNITMKATNKFDTVNFEGAPAYSLDVKGQLVSLMLTSFLKDQFYRSGDETLETLKILVSQTDPKFAAKAAIFARDEFGMRSVSHVVAAEIARYVKGEQWLRAFYKAVVVRPDDVTEIMAYWIANYGKPVPNAMKRGLGDALASFDAYRLGKYKGEGKSLSLVDVVNLCHPKHTEPLGALINGTLEPPETWEVELTRAGQTCELPEEKAAVKEAVWVKLLSEHKLGYFAALRNIRNIVQQAPVAVDMLAEQLVNEEAIRKSRILPFRFLSAWDALADVSTPRLILEALSDATDISVQNTPVFEGKTLVAVDGSGSMAWRADDKGPRPIQIAALFAAALYRTNDADVLIFDDSVMWPALNPKDSVRTNTSFIEKQARAGGTNFHLIFDSLKTVYDRVVILSDMAAWIPRGTWGGNYSPISSHKDYCARTGADPFVYCLDLQGYGSAQFPSKKVVQLSGWSDKVFDYIKLSERGTDAMVQAVEAIAL